MVDIKTDWISEFDETDKKYTMFYKDDISKINIIFLYIDRNYNLFYVKKEQHKLNDGILDKHVLINILQKNMEYNGKKYRPLSLLKYNITMSPIEITDYMNNQNEPNYLTSENSIQDLKWEQSIKKFSDLNSLHILFFETWKKKDKSHTRKIYINSNSKKTKHKKTKKNKNKL
jgi:hypothetical protein